MVADRAAWRRWREAVMLGAVLCVAGVMAMVIVHESEQQTVELLFKWGPPSIRPGGQHAVQLDATPETNVWSPPTMLPQLVRTEEVARPVVEVVEEKRAQQREHHHPPMALDVNVNQADTEGDKFAPVNVNIVLPGKPEDGNALKQFVADQAQQQAHAVAEQPGEHTSPVMPVAAFAAVPQQAVAPGRPIRMVAATQQHPRQVAKAMPAVTMALASTQPQPAPEEQVEKMVADMVSATALRGMEETLQEEISDAQDSAITSRGVDKVHRLQREERAVAQRLAQLPSLLSSKIQSTGKEADAAADSIAKIQSDLRGLKNKMVVAKKEEAPRMVRELQAKVELQRAAADALADVMDKPPMHFKHLDIPDKSSYSGPSVRVLKTEQARLRKELAQKQTEYKTAEGEHRALVSDEERAEEATQRIGEDAMFSEARSPTAGLEARSRRLASKGRASKQMLAEEGGAEWCQWGSQMVPCKPGQAGAWKGHHVDDAGIWPASAAQDKHAPVRRDVTAGKRSHSYMDDAFKYGADGIFGVKKDGPKVAHDKMLSGGHANDRDDTRRAGWAEQAERTQRQHQELAKHHRTPAVTQQASQQAGSEKGSKTHEKTLNEIVERGLQVDRLRHNTVAPEWTDRLLGKAKKTYSYMASHLDYSRLPSGDKLANEWGASVHGLVDPEYIDALIKPPSDKSGHRGSSQGSNGLDTQASSLARIRPLTAPKALTQPAQNGKALEEESRLERQRKAALDALERVAGVN